MTAESEKVSLRDFFENKIDALEYQNKLRFDALDKALILNKNELERRLEGLNQLREEVTRDRTQYLTRVEYESKHLALVEWKEVVNTKLTTLETRSITWTAAVGLFFLILNIVAKWITL